MLYRIEEYTAVRLGLTSRNAFNCQRLVAISRVNPACYERKLGTSTVACNATIC